MKNTSGFKSGVILKTTEKNRAFQLISDTHCDSVDTEQIPFVGRPPNLEITLGNHRESPRNKRNCSLDVSQNDTFDLGESDTLPASETCSINNNSGQDEASFDVQIGGTKDLQNLKDCSCCEDCGLKSLLFERSRNMTCAESFGIRKRKVSDTGKCEMCTGISNERFFSKNIIELEVEKRKQNFVAQRTDLAVSDEIFQPIYSRRDSCVRSNIAPELFHVESDLLKDDFHSELPYQSFTKPLGVHSIDPTLNLFPVKSPLESVILKNRNNSLGRCELPLRNQYFKLESLINNSGWSGSYQNPSNLEFGIANLGTASDHKCEFDKQFESFECLGLSHQIIPPDTDASVQKWNNRNNFSNWYPANSSTASKLQSTGVLGGRRIASLLNFDESVRDANTSDDLNSNDDYLQCNAVKGSERNPSCTMKAEDDYKCKEITKNTCGPFGLKPHQISTDVFPQRPVTLSLKKSSSCGSLTKAPINIDYSDAEEQSFEMSYLKKRKIVSKLPSLKSLSSIDDCSSSVSSITKLLLTSTSTQLTETPTTPPFTKSLFCEINLARNSSIKVISSNMSNSSPGSFSSTDSIGSNSSDNTCRGPRLVSGSGSFESTLVRTASDESSLPPSPLSAKKPPVAPFGNIKAESCTIFENWERESSSSNVTRTLKSYRSGKPADQLNRIDSSASISSCSSNGLNQTVYDSLDCQYGKFFPDGSILRLPVSSRRECCSSGSSKRSSIEVGDSFRPINYRNFPYIDNSSQGSFGSYLSHTSPESFICLADKCDVTPSPQTSPRMKEKTWHLSNSSSATPVLRSRDSNGSFEEELNEYLIHSGMLNTSQEKELQNFAREGQFSERVIEQPNFKIRLHSRVDLDSMPTTARNSIPIIEDAMKEGAICSQSHGQRKQVGMPIQHDNFCRARPLPYSSSAIAPFTINHGRESNEQIPSFNETSCISFDGPKSTAMYSEGRETEVHPTSEHDHAKSFQLSELWSLKPSFSPALYFSRRKKLKRKRRRLISRLREQDIEQVFQLYFFSDPATSSLSPLCSPFVTPSPSTPGSPVTCHREHDPTIFGTVAGDQCPKDSTKRGLPQTPKGGGLRGSHGNQDTSTTPEWATLPDDDNSLVYEDGVLVSGSLQALVQHATPTSSYYPDTAYLFAFLLSSRLFIKPHDLLQRVSDLGFTQQGLQNDDTSAVDKDKLEKFVVHIVQLLGEWSETFPYDFRDERVMSCVRTITHRCIALQPNLRRDVTQILHNLLNKLTHLERYEESLSKHTVAPPADSLSD
ncbi:Ras-like guanine nucleotide exchange factor N-terminal, partial [Trinorchestia longiramus]